MESLLQCTQYPNEGNLLIIEISNQGFPKKKKKKKKKIQKQEQTRFYQACQRSEAHIKLDVKRHDSNSNSYHINIKYVLWFSI